LKSEKLKASGSNYFLMVIFFTFPSFGNRLRFKAKIKGLKANRICIRIGAWLVQNKVRPKSRVGVYWLSFGGISQNFLVPVFAWMKFLV